MNKYNNGITMISLIITIVIILIITGVAISELDDQGLAQKAKKETQWQQQEIQNEQNKMEQVRNEQLQDWGF